MGEGWGREERKPCDVLRGRGSPGGWGNISSYHRMSSFPTQLESGPCQAFPLLLTPLAGTSVSAVASFLHPGENKGILKFFWHHVPASSKGTQGPS